MGQARTTVGLSNAAGGRSARGLVARLTVKVLRDRSGATAIEYALIVSLIFLVIITSMTIFGNKTTGMYDFISATIASKIP